MHRSPLLLPLVAAVLLGGAAHAHVSLIDPNGGQTLVAGTTYTIRWTVLIQHSTLNWDLHYSLNGASGPWLPIALDLPPGNISAGAVHSYQWTVPNTPSTRVRVRITQDNSGRSYEDISDGDLTIAPAPAAYTAFGAGCAGSAGAPSLAAASGSRPLLGATFTARIANAGAGSTGAFLATGWTEVAPASLAGLGMPGCNRHLDVLAADFVAIAGGAGTAAFLIPNSSALLAFEFLQQALVFDPGAGNAAGAVVTNPARGLISDR